MLYFAVTREAGPGDDDREPHGSNATSVTPSLGYAGHSGRNDAGTTATYIRADIHEVATVLSALTGEQHPLAWPASDQSTRVVEIGSGTGQLTAALAAHGCPIVAVELRCGDSRTCRGQPRPLPRVSVEVAAFERWQPPESLFDVVVAATAFHRLDLTVAIDKVAGVLRPGGRLVTVTTAHIVGGSEAFFRDVSPMRNVGRAMIGSVR